MTSSSFSWHVPSVYKLSLWSLPALVTRLVCVCIYARVCVCVRKRDTETLQQRQRHDLYLSLWTGLTAHGGNGKKSTDKDGNNKRKRASLREIVREAKIKKGTREKKKKKRKSDKYLSPPVITSCRSASASTRHNPPTNTEPSHQTTVSSSPPLFLFSLLSLYTNRKDLDVFPIIGSRGWLFFLPPPPPLFFFCLSFFFLFFCSSSSFTDE